MLATCEYCEMRLSLLYGEEDVNFGKIERGEIYTALCKSFGSSTLIYAIGLLIPLGGWDSVDPLSNEE